MRYVIFGLMVLALVALSSSQVTTDRSSIPFFLGQVVLVVLTTDPWLNLDGRLNAPGGTAQYPHLLDLNSPGTQTFGVTYVARPPWKVAGVDYAVGPRISSFSDPAPGFVSNSANGSTTGIAAALVAQGATWNGSNSMEFGTANQVISGWDFSLHGGLRCDVNASGLTFQDCNFQVGTLAKPFIVGADSLTVQYCKLNGNGVNNTDQAGGLLQLGTNTETTITVLYNWFRQADYQHIQIGPPQFGKSGKFTMKYNLLEDCGMGHYKPEAAHGDYIQAFSSNSGSPNPTFDDMEISFNTFLETNSNSNTQGLSLVSAAGNTAVVLSEEIKNNTMIANATGGVAGGGGLVVNYHIIVDNTWLNGSATVSQNYCDNTAITGAWLFFGNFNAPGGGGPFTGTISKNGNINMVDGTTLT